VKASTAYFVERGGGGGRVILIALESSQGKKFGITNGYEKERKEGKAGNLQKDGA